MHRFIGMFLKEILCGWGGKAQYFDRIWIQFLVGGNFSGRERDTTIYGAREPTP